MSDADWSDVSLLTLIAEWPKRHRGHHIDFATLLEKAPDQNPKLVARELKQLGNMDLLRVKDADDIPFIEVNFLGFKDSKGLLLDFQRAMEYLAKPERPRVDVISMFREEMKELSERQLVVNPVLSAIGKRVRHYHPVVTAT